MRKKASEVFVINNEEQLIDILMCRKRLYIIIIPVIQMNILLLII